MKKSFTFLLYMVLISSIIVPSQVFAQTTSKSAVKVVASKVDINHADSAELQTIPGIGVKLAERIIAYRKQHGAFKTPQELQNVRGIGEKSLAKLLPWVNIR